MKKRVSVILLTLSMLCLASCGIAEAPKNIVSTPKPTATTPSVKEESANTETTPEPTQNLTAAELFASVLRDEKSIYFSELGASNYRAHSGYYRSYSVRTSGRRNPGSCFWSMLIDKQYNGTYITIFCIFTIYEYNRTYRCCKSNLDFCGLSDFDW